MQNDFERVTREVSAKITPSEAKRSRMLALAKDLELRVSAACENLGIPAKVRLEGSLAKDTWLREDPDVDVFMRLPKTIARKDLGEIALKIARKATEGAQQIERFAEHPYLEAFVDGMRVNIVPCYETTPGDWLSATDRTPYHTDYINEKLKTEQRAEVRLLKRFMKGVGVYGAEIKIGGFSGYLCELLVLHYGSFAKVLESFSHLKSKMELDLQGHYEHRQRELQLLFPEPLVVVDPIDKARNVASAVQPLRLYTFVAAVRSFLKKPRSEFFFPPKVMPITADELRKVLKLRGSALVFLTFSLFEAVPDVLWGQLYRTRKALSKHLELNEFRVLRDGVFSQDKSSFVVFVFELEQLSLASVRKHAGPPLELGLECEHFLKKYSSNKEVLAGPLIDDGRWVVELPRKFTEAIELLRVKLGSGGREIGVAELIAEAIKKDFVVLEGAEITEHYVHNDSFAEWLTEFLSGKPFWLKF